MARSYYEQVEHDQEMQREAIGQARLAAAIALALIALFIWGVYGLVRAWFT